MSSIIPESIEAASEQRRLDDQYEQRGKDATPETTKEIQEKAMGGLYGKFIGNNLESNSLNNNDLVGDENIEVSDRQQKLNKIEESIDNKDFTDKDLYEFAKNELTIISGDKEQKEDIKILSRYITGFENSTVDKSMNEVNKSNESKSERIEDFGEAAEKVNGMDEFLEKSKDDTSMEAELYNMIGRNFTEVEIGDKESLNIAIENSGDYILERYINIPDSETKKVAINKINGDSISAKLEGIKSLYLLAAVGSASGARMEKVKKWIVDRNEDRKLKMAEEYFSNSRLLENTLIEKNIKTKLENNQKSLEDESKEIEKGDVFNVGEEDVMSDNLSEGNEAK